MKCKTIILLAAGILALAACSEEQLKPRDYTKPVGNRVALSLRAALADGSTMLWDQSAKIGIFASGGTVNVPCSISASSAGTEQGQFYSQVDWTSAGSELYVYYPYNEDNTTAVLSGRLPQTYSQQSLSALNKSNMFYAKITDGAPAEGGFKDVGLSSVLAVSSLKLSTATYAGWNLERVSLKSTAGEILSGSYTYDIATDTFTMLTDGTDSIAVNISGEVLGDAGSDVYWLSKSGRVASSTPMYLISGEMDII